MAIKKPAKIEGEEVRNNVDNLNAHAKEFATGKMDPKKAMMLKLKLVSLWIAKTITESELNLLESILSRELKRAQIEDKHLEILNRIEAAQCTEKAKCKVDDAPRVFHVLKDQVCNIKREDQANLKKIEAGSVYQYTVFVERTIPPEHQMTKELLLKEERGHHADESMYPKERILLHRLVLDDQWFGKIFDIEEDLLSEAKETEETYTF